MNHIFFAHTEKNYVSNLMQFKILWQTMHA